MQFRPEHVEAEYELYMIYGRIKQSAPAQTALAKWKELEVLDREVRRELANLEHAREARYGHSMQAGARVERRVSGGNTEDENHQR